MAEDELIEIDGIKLTQTGNVSPEQYDASKGETRVGYLRLRHGLFTVQCPDVEGELVFEAEPEGDGMFEPEERAYYLTKAVAAITGWLTSHPERHRR